MREVWPEIIRTREIATPKCFASARSIAQFARPSFAGSFTKILNSVSEILSIFSSLAEGLARTVIFTAALAPL